MKPAPVAPGKELARDEKVENLVTNFSMIMMGMFEGVFAAMASGLATALTKTAEALTDSLDSGGTSKAKAAPPPPNTDAEMKAKIKEAFSGLRKEVEEGFSKKDESFVAFIRDPSFDAGVKIVESHRLKLPPLTQPLSDEELAGYVTLIQDGDPEVAAMMQELGEWQKTTPRFGH